MAAYADCGQICRVGEARRCCRSEAPRLACSDRCTVFSVCSLTLIVQVMLTSSDRSGCT